MVDIDELLVTTIRTAWLQVNGPGRGCPNKLKSRPPDEFVLPSNARELSPLHHARHAATASDTH